MERQKMIDEMEWLEAGSGTGFGICRVANMLFMWGTDEPGPDRPDLKSVVAVKGNPEDYTDEELTALYEFSQRQTADYDKHWRYRRGANLIIIGKRFGKWLRKRMSWDMGEMWSDSLEDAMAVFDRDLEVRCQRAS